jgi:hypothetical protein
MNQNETKEYFDYHNANMKSIKIGYDELRNQIKSFYKLSDNNGTLIYSLQDSNPKKIELRKKEKSFSRILSGIQASWAEESLKRLLYERDFLNDTQRNYILSIPLGQKWIEIFKIAFCIEYDLVPVNNDICDGVNIKQEKNNLGNELVEQYFSLRKIITKHLTPSFEIRNKVQHGEWEFAFKPPISEEFSQRWTDKINKENLITTTSRYTLVNAVYNMIVDLGRFRSNSFALDSITTPFEYFHERYMKKINFEVNKIQNCDLEKFIDDIVQKEIRGLIYKNGT